MRRPNDARSRLASLDRMFGTGSADGAGFNDLETIVNMTDPYEGIEIVIDDGEDNLSLEDLLHGTEEPPAIRLVNSVILEAIRQGASDIHIQPRTKNVMVRYRIDGILMDKIQIPHALHQSFVSRLKVMSELDISERRRPQDGRITVKTPLRVVDLRISTLPTINGEKVVMRILDRNAAVLSLEGLGFQPGSGTTSSKNRTSEALTSRRAVVTRASTPARGGLSTTTSAGRSRGRNSSTRAAMARDGARSPRAAHALASSSSSTAETCTPSDWSASAVSPLPL